MTWRKLPRDLLTNEQFEYIESRLDPKFICAPYMFYLAALRQADDDGIFDLEDGVVFSRLMKIGSPELVFQIGNLMQLRKIITRVSADSNKCLINDWEYPKNKPSRTMAERRKIVLSKIDEEKKLQPKMDLFKAHDIKREAAATQENLISFQPQPDMVDATGLFDNNPASNFFCPENDKNAENVVKKNDDDKNAKNVVIENQTERETVESRLEIENKETHRDSGLRGSMMDPLQPQDKNPALAETDATESTEKLEQSEQSMTQRGNSAAPDDDSSYSDDTATTVDEGMKGPTIDYLKNWFAKNCYGYKQNAGRKAIDEIACNIVINLSDKNNPPETIAAVLCTEFKKLSETQGYYYNMPLLPAYMKKPGVWAHIVAKAGKFLDRGPQNRFSEQAKKYEAEYEQDREQVYDAFNSQYLKYGVDPNDPNRILKLQQAKKAAEGGSN